MRVPPTSAVPRAGALERATATTQVVSTIEARVLASRRARSRRTPSEGGGPGLQRRASTVAADPVGSRVLVILVEDAAALPERLEEHRLFLRWVRR
jgi:hypothetical protein